VARTPGAERSNRDDATTNPTSSNDATEGWDVGSRWVNTTNGTVWFAVNVSTGAAVWKDVTSTVAGGGHPVHVNIDDPTATDDINAGYEVGDHWINTTSKTVWQALDVSAGAAIWDRIDQPKRNVTAVVDPTISDDDSQGYEPGSFWINTVSSQAFVSLDASTGAAVWKRTTNRKVTVSASLPTVNDDSTQGFEVGSWWITTATQARLYRAMDVSVGAAIWKRDTNYKDNVTAVTDPTVNDDNTQGYEPGSIWINTTTDEIFAATSTGTGAAKWVTTVAVTGSPAVNPGEVMYGTLLDYPAAGNVTSSTVFYIRLKLGAGLVLQGMRTFIDSGGTGGRHLRMGIYNQLDPSSISGEPYTKQTETIEVATNGLNGSFTTLSFTGGNYTIPVTGYYWFAIISDSTSLKFAVTAPVRANFLPKREEVSTGTVLPATAVTLSNPVSSVIYLAGIEA